MWLLGLLCTAEVQVNRMYSCPCWENTHPSYLPGVLLTHTCMEHDVAEYLNITEREHLLLLTMPKKDWRKPMTVSVDILFIAILSVVEKTETIDTYFWISVDWRNEFVSWDPDDFCNITHLTLPSSLFWVPDLFFHEQVDDDSSPWMRYVNVSYNGIITAAKPTHLTSSCILDIYYFPFDVQKCSMSITSYMYKESNMVLKSLKNSSELQAESMELLLKNGEWRVLDLVVEESTAHGYSKLQYSVTIKRQASVYILSLVLPTLALQLLDILCFFIPKAYNEKANFKLTVLLGASVLALILHEFLPASSSEPPVIVSFFIGTMCLMIIGIVQMIFLMFIGGKLNKSHVASSGIFPLHQGLFLKCGSKEVQSVDDDQVPEDGLASMLEKICRDMQLVREQILSMQDTERMEKEQSHVLERVDRLMFVSHLVLVVIFYTAIFVNWIV